MINDWSLDTAVLRSGSNKVSGLRTKKKSRKKILSLSDQEHKTSSALRNIQHFGNFPLDANAVQPRFWPVLAWFGSGLRLVSIVVRTSELLKYEFLARRESGAATFVASFGPSAALDWSQG